MDIRKGIGLLNGLIGRLERNHRTLKSHPTIDKIERGELSSAQLRHWATQLYIGNKGHNANILGLIYAKCDDFGARRAIVENLLEEELGRQSGVGRSHMEFYLEFGEAIGIPREELAACADVARRHCDGALDVLAGGFQAVVRHAWPASASAPNCSTPTRMCEWSTACVDTTNCPMTGCAFSPCISRSTRTMAIPVPARFSAPSRKAPQPRRLWAVEMHIEFMRRLWSDTDPPIE